MKRKSYRLRHCLDQITMEPEAIQFLRPLADEEGRSVGAFYFEQLGGPSLVDGSRQPRRRWCRMRSLGGTTDGGLHANSGRTQPDMPRASSRWLHVTPPTGAFRGS